MTDKQTIPSIDLISDTPQISGQLKLSTTAVAKLKSLAKDGDQDHISLRVEVFGGGCYGMQYRFELDVEKKDEEFSFVHENIAVYIDDVSLNFLKESIIHFSEDLMGAAFVINNPNAVSSCGCGSSFSVI